MPGHRLHRLGALCQAAPGGVGAAAAGGAARGLAFAVARAAGLVHVEPPRRTNLRVRLVPHTEPRALPSNLHGGVCWLRFSGEGWFWTSALLVSPPAGGNLGAILLHGDIPQAGHPPRDCALRGAVHPPAVDAVDIAAPLLGQVPPVTEARREVDRLAVGRARAGLPARPVSRYWFATRL
ncbi:uncharacterized protein BcabD6B2_52010 [Babesia caballi]|uniref:Uncharacterized protein n=1 Tax=Babesia caballi TaxID=5871 RepID=A0AAV4M100_BABCB|nr:hypothetical protein BcabD6B2_52010 [Babesia caballi]